MNTLKEEEVITLYTTGHDANATYIDKNEKLTTIEFERWSNIKYYRTPAVIYNEEKFKEKYGLLNFLKFIGEECKNKNNIKKIILAVKREKIYWKNNEIRQDLHFSGRDKVADKMEVDFCDVGLNIYKNTLKEIFPNARVSIVCNHHYAHAASSYYESPANFEKCLIFSYDGAGDTLKSTKKECNTIEELKKIRRTNYNTGFLFCANSYKNKFGIKFIKTFKPQKFGGLYTMFGRYLNIKFPDGRTRPVTNTRLAAPGKFMGYTAFGKRRRELIDLYKGWWRREVNGERIAKWENTATGSPLDIVRKYDPADAPDVAASAQAAFEELIEELIFPIVKQKKLPLIITGGCAMNVLVNQRLAMKMKEELGLDLYVNYNPSDTGLSQGMFFLEFPKHRKPLTYNGIRMIDDIKPYLTKYNITTTSNVKDVVEQIKNGKIIGCAHEGSELGPRALGNRSIICKPDPEMKDILNAKIKFREWFRPFGPVCRVEDKDKFFDNALDSPYMSFAPLVKPEYREKLKSITHIDGSARLQTVTREQNSFFYDILTEMQEQNMIPVILNTSFNIKGKPILTRYESAFEALEETDLDCLFLDKQYLIHKQI